MTRNMDYIIPNIKVIELKAQEVLCSSDTKLGSSSIESYTEKDLDW